MEIWITCDWYGFIIIGDSGNTMYAFDVGVFKWTKSILPQLNKQTVNLWTWS